MIKFRIYYILFYKHSALLPILVAVVVEDNKPVEAGHTSVVAVEEVHKVVVHNKVFRTFFYFNKN
jgi:hypothetical protein